MSMIDYGFRVGLPRLIDLLAEAGVVPAAFVNRLALERHTESVVRLRDLGCTIVGHGIDQNTLLSNIPADDFGHIVGTCRDSFAEIGVDVRGWSSPATRDSMEGLTQMAREGIEYHVGLHADELPYWLEFHDGSSLLEIGPAHAAAGRPWKDFPPGGMRLLLERWLAEAGTRPLLVPLSFHPHLDGRPDIAAEVRDTLRWLRSQDSVWLTNVGEVADWIKQQPKRSST
jgi:hypothetical protein